MTDPYDIWKRFWSDEIMEGIIEATNTYYDKELKASRVNLWQQKQWKPLTMPFLQIWLALHIKMQLDYKPTIESYWRAPVGSAEPANRFGNYMSVDVSHFTSKFIYKSS
jgi:hypothetical protein